MKFLRSFAALTSAIVLTAVSWTAQAEIKGIVGTTTDGHQKTFNLEVAPASINTPDGDSLLIWAYGDLDNTSTPVQYPGPTLIVNEGDAITINLTNTSINEPVSMVFPGQKNVAAVVSTVVPGAAAAADPNRVVLTEEASMGETVTYSFTASQPGTYLYHSGSNPDLQVEMGLSGALIVRPATNPDSQAYNSADSYYDHEYLYFLTEMDPSIHQAVDFGMTPDTSNFHAVLWFMNGRNGPDTLFDHDVPWMPNQPYSSLTRMHPGEKVLLRIIGAGHDMHPLHTHGNHFLQIARDGALLSSDPGNTAVGADLAFSDYTQQVLPGATYDALFEWTGKNMGWDIYGHTTGSGALCNGLDSASDSTDPVTFEDCNFHNVPIPVDLPENLDLTYGGFYSGSPYLGAMASLPPGEGGLNLNGGLFFMWHSHTEKELVNNDIFPGGMMTMLIIEPTGVPIP
ncbi:multicopper oxidase domain-containing protein [uncultured Amphritea sp.]|uniref:multicopper oxidase domain-containing protein n=1 Tax=uncultured Amphritea sp. TaxID=981605 RepID=UPI0026128B74|nr:multicopper oxidase domain-containing protein [uncultured Amphritea sp.]